MVGPTVGEAIDAAITDESTEFVFAVVASRVRGSVVYVVSRQVRIPAAALRHVDNLREAVLESIIRYGNPDEIQSNEMDEGQL